MQPRRYEIILEFVLPKDHPFQDYCNLNKIVSLLFSS
jgi:hypothetical protein